MRTAFYVFYAILCCRYRHCCDCVYLPLPMIHGVLCKPYLTIEKLDSGLISLDRSELCGGVFIASKYEIPSTRAALSLCNATGISCSFVVFLFFSSSSKSTKRLALTSCSTSQTLLALSSALDSYSRPTPSTVTVRIYIQYPHPIPRMRSHRKPPGL